MVMIVIMEMRIGKGGGTGGGVEAKWFETSGRRRSDSGGDGTTVIGVASR